MSRRVRRRIFPARRSSRLKGPSCARSRPLLVENLEQRLLLAGDLPAWQNPILHEDVNADSVVGAVDVLLIANELYRTGSRYLVAEPPLEPTGAAADSDTTGAEGEDAGPLYVDVNGDNYLTPVDAILVIAQLNAEGQTDQVQMRFEVTDTAGTPINSIDVGQSFELQVYIQDIRPDTVPDRGVFSAYLDIFYDTPLISVTGPITYGPEYQMVGGQPDTSTPGEIQDAGNAQSSWSQGPLGGGEFLLLTVPLTADVAPIAAVNDDATTDAGLNVAEDASEVLLNVLANDSLGGPADLWGAPGNNPPATDVYFLSDPYNPVPPEDIIYGNDTIVVNSTGSLAVTAVGPTSEGGSAVIAPGGTHVQYTPPPGSNSLGAGETATDSFSYTISDGSSTDTAIATVTIVGENDDPTAQNTSMGANEDAPVNGSLASLASDPDTNDSLSFSGDTASALGAAVTVNPDGTFTYDPTVSATLNALPAGISDTDTFSYTVLDQHGGSDSATVTVAVVGVNDPPEANHDSGPDFTTDQDTAFITANVLANDTDPDGDTLSIASISVSATLGTVTDNGNGTFSYDPNGKFDALPSGQSNTDSFTYATSDGKGGGDTATVTITINGLDDPPVANDDFGAGFTTDQDTSLVTANVLANDTDADGDTLFVSGINTTGTKGQVADNGDGTFNYDPNGQFDYLDSSQVTSDSFTYTVSDGNGGSDTATVTITVTGLNDGPTAQNGSFSTNEDTPINDTLVNLADDPDAADMLVFSNGSSSNLGASVTINPNGTFTYDPTASAQLQALLPGESLPDTFSFTVSDGDLSDSAEITITVSGLNDAPVAGDDSLFVDEQTSDNVLDVLANDSDADGGDSMTIISVGPTDQGGNAAPAGDGLSIVYTPADSFIGTETFSYTIRDAAGAIATATVQVEVEAVTLPRARNDSFTVVEDSQNNDLDVYANDLINAGGTPGIALSGPPDQGGSVVITGPTTLQYTPATDFSGTETFYYTLSDNVGVPEQAVVTVTVTGINDPPVANDDSGPGFTTDEDTAFVTTDVRANDTDADGDTLSVIGFDPSSTLGTVADNGDGTFTYDPNGQFDSLSAGESTTDTFTYTLSDGHDASDTATVTITINGVNDPPQAGDDSGVGFTTDQDTPLLTGNVLDNDTDAEGHPLSVTGIDTTGTVGQVTDNYDGTFNYDPNGQFDSLGPGESTTDTFTYTVSDGNGGFDTATVTITVTGVNNPPVATADSGVGFTTDEDTSFATANVLTNDTDADGGTLSVSSIDTTGTVGTVTNNDDGTFSYEPKQRFEWLGSGQSTTDTFTYTLSDGQGGFDTATVAITVNGINDAPVAVDDTGAGFATDQDTALTTASVLTNDSDAENDPLSVTEIDTTGTVGQVIDNGDGTFDYDPNGQFDYLGSGETATDTFSYTVSDGNSGMAVATVSVTVTGLNDGPTAEDAVFNSSEDVQFSDSVASKASDPDSSDTLTFSGGGTSAEGSTVTLNADGTFSYNPLTSATLQALLPGQSLPDTFSYTVTDGDGMAACGTVTVNISGVNDNPTATADDFPGFLEDSSDNVLDVLANDSTAPETGETLTITSVGTTSGGGTVVNDGFQLRYTPAPDFFGTEQFSYTISDDHGGSDTATVTVTVAGQNDPPTTADDTYEFISGTGPHVLDVLANDTIAPDTGETLTITSVSTPDKGGTVVNQGGSLQYTPPSGIQGQITETFTYTVDDGSSETATATVTIQVAGFTRSTLAGSAFVDTSGDGLQASGERGVGGIQVTLTGTDIFGNPVSLTKKTLYDGSYSFANLVPGDYTVTAEQPAFLLDGMDRVGTQGGNSTADNQLSISIGAAGGVSGRLNNFCEFGLQPQYISIWDFLNSSSREGVLFAVDRQSGQLWFSFLDGWNGYTSANAEFSADGSSLDLTFGDQSSQTSTITVAYAESAVLHIRGSVGTQHLVQLVGSAADFGLPAAASAGLSGEGEGISSLPEGEGPQGFGSPPDDPASLATAALVAEAAEDPGPGPIAASPVEPTGSTVIPAQEPGLAVTRLEDSALGRVSATLESDGGPGIALFAYPPSEAPASLGAAGATSAPEGAMETTASSAGEMGASADQGLAVVDAVFSSGDDEDAWDPLFGLDDLSDHREEDDFDLITEGLICLWDETPV